MKPTIVENLLSILCCPYCGGQEISTYLEEWPAYSENDPGNNATLHEHQCGTSAEASTGCGRSFWTP